MALMNTTPKMTDESTHSPRNAVTADRHEQDVNQRLVELLEKLEPRRRAAPRGDAVRAEFLLAAEHFLCGQAAG